jgi:hypothetical protein
LPSRELHQTEGSVKVFRGVQVVPQPAVFGLASQPLAEPILDVLVDGAIGVAHRAAAEIIRR